MTTLSKIQTVANESELYLIQLEYRTFIDKYNTQSLENYETLLSMFDSNTRGVMQKIQSETHRLFGASGMVLVSQILPSMGLLTNHKILD